MLKLMSLVCFSFLSISMVHADRVDECSHPGEKIGSEFVGLVSEPIKRNFQRSGGPEIPSNKEFSGEVSTVISKNYRNQYCTKVTYSVEETKCSSVDIDLALGRGNAIFKSFYDLSQSLLKRSQLFSQTLQYDASSDPTTRLETAKVIVTFLVSKASEKLLPTKWENFTELLNELVITGKITQATLDGIENGVGNKAALGFLPAKDTKITEGEGNRTFNSLFNLSISEYDRVQIIENYLVGISTSNKYVLAKDFIEFASVNGIPATWAQLDLMFKALVEKNSLSQVEYQNVIGRYEMSNRNNLGFKIEASRCTKVMRSATVNEVQEKFEKEFQSRATKKVNLLFTEAPLLFNEVESATITYDELSPTTIEVNSKFNKFSITSSTGHNELTFNLKGERIKVTPKNTSFAQILKTGDVLDMFYQNTSYNPRVGKVVVYVDFYERRFFADKFLGTRQLVPVDGNLVKYLAQVKMQNSSKAPYILVKMKYENSPYYNGEFSAVERFNQ